MFSQNAMAALYQIAQSDPPQLDAENGWSPSLLQLVHSLLQKNPQDRPTAAAALNFDYFSKTENRPDIVLQLIR